MILLTRLLARLGYRFRRPGKVLANELACLKAMEQDGPGSVLGANWARGARFGIEWAAGIPGTMRPSEALRRARLAAKTGAGVG